LDDCGFCECGQCFQGKLGRRVCGSRWEARGNAASAGCAERIKLHVEMVRFEEPMLSVISAFEGNPFRGTFSQDEVLDRIAIKTQASHGREAEARADCGFGFVKIAAGIVFFKAVAPTATPLISTFAPRGA